jgi:hypothetical protein
MPKQIYVCVCVCARARVRARLRERERNTDGRHKFLFKIISNSMYSIGHKENGLMKTGRARTSRSTHFCA